MKTDPRKGCANVDERFAWALVHDLVAHPLMALTCWSAWSLRFHDYTSFRAWPRPQEHKPETVWFMTAKFGRVRVESSGPGFWRAYHGIISHAVTVKAASAFDAMAQAVAWFEEVVEVVPHSARATA